MSEKKIRWGILGCANIAVRAVIPGTQKSETGVVAAIASRGIGKAQETAEKMGIPTAYGSYEELLADESIDAVYIPLPNHLHKEWTIKAAEAGKHVLCEKPAALNAEETREMAAACEKAGVIFAEAFMYRYHPRYQMIREIIASGEIGEVRGIHGAFTFNNAKDTGNVRYQQHMGGGSIYDVGVYPISAARFILGQEPEAATVHGFFSPEHDGVDMMASGLLEFPNSVALTFDCGMWAAGRNVLEILGTDGRIEVPSAFVTNGSERDHFIVHAKGESREVQVPYLNQYALQADAIGRSVLYGEPMPFGPQDAVNGMRVVDACLTSARERRRIEL
ncbi:Gfo/Idh/MocA family protein [Paenibacillus mucilaginosus]|uniref:Oxidoreductase domain-containing protein n=3 Tax=Paenibacillus mucilaginosus TaxID=61624 RepID=H6NFJ6_9BACL|nr:Gfo/Idh/MocA family oxidoreductase [Paenibacillus mucilaginosus]AEI41548.1 oxidoreductase domain protein [Paenibacillus mucilaginosus KNP414]AFC30082.1 oxidoreductase domain-containing protein [Paenibacillus mucilaginosus 3016]AFH62344.1 oxidoreductase [Paenibacillus mucilaginosus K02]MCG7215416.1 Gfo/Idh/MocA family oxidoreductase [Paenibacillus mucilaginosus]WDM30552.1 Gfo/Idh/MocA family oxidoreductase [Paenibacillus mucilaginosus]